MQQMLSYGLPVAKDAVEKQLEGQIALKTEII
jgi:hypothetical protein